MWGRILAQTFGQKKLPPPIELDRPPEMPSGEEQERQQEGRKIETDPRKISAFFHQLGGGE